jgi:sulfofructose kinase
MKILGIGESVIDNLYLVDDAEPDIRSAPAKHVGGPVLIALLLLARLGEDCTLVTSLGKDEGGEIIKHLAKREHVTLIPKMQKKTKVNTVLTSTNTGQRKKLRGTTVHRKIKDLGRNFIRQFDVIILDRHERDAFYEVIKMKKPSAKIIIDPSTEISKFTLDMIKYADYPIIPIEAVTPTYTRSLENIDHVLARLYEWTQKPLIITAGNIGSFIYDGKQAELLAPLTVNTVDTLGAGDVYRGAFAYGVIQGWDLKKTARFSNIVAALQCTRIGNAAALPTKEEMMQYHDNLLVAKKLTTCTITNIYLQLQNKL